MNINVTKKDIGKELYPIDNSYSQDLRTGEYPDVNNGAALAGSNWVDSVKVKIVSEPIYLKLQNAVGKMQVQEMVIVEYKDTKFIVLNNFSEKCIVAENMDYHNL